MLGYRNRECSGWRNMKFKRRGTDSGARFLFCGRILTSHDSNLVAKAWKSG
jgi:hypothetical protein